jgi:signal transduction histidine kinase
MILKAAHNITAITTNLLRYGRESIVEKRKTDLSQVVRDTLNLLGISLTRRGISLIFRPKDEDLYVYGNPVQLQEVYTNLILNARDAMPSGGTIRITARKEGAYVLSTISDTGIGISKENLEKIFELGYTTKEDKGEGLGLSICRRIITDHGGEIKVKSQLGRGTEFTILLPLYTAE